MIHSTRLATALVVVLATIASAGTIALAASADGVELVMTNRTNVQSVKPGGLVIYMMTVRNGGSVTADSVIFGGSVPSFHAKLVSLSDQRCTSERNLILCEFENLAPGKQVSASFTIRVAADAPCDYGMSVLAQTSSSPQDVDQNNNASTATAVTDCTSTFISPASVLRERALERRKTRMLSWQAAALLSRSDERRNARLGQTDFRSTFPCRDTDGGRNFFLKGNTTSDKGTTIDAGDMCVGRDGKSVLYEYYCNGDIIEFVTTECATSCSEGACVR